MTREAKIAREQYARFLSLELNYISVWEHDKDCGLYLISKHLIELTEIATKYLN